MEREPGTNGKADKTPLYIRLYFDAAYYEIVRLIGYPGLPLADARAGIQTIGKKHDKERLVKACEELLDITNDFVRLKAETRKLAWQLLGPPPDYKETPIEEVIGRIPEQKPINGKPQPKPRKSEPKVNKTGYGSKRKKGGAVPGGGTWSEKTPVMAQYRAAKEKHPNMLLLFRMGDFYELFDEDAETASKLLGLTITSRDGCSMSGFPHHQLEVYLKKLLHEGKRVAVCDQIDSDDGKRVNREVTRVVTPGSIVESEA